MVTNMKKILLISNYVFHYRINNYNYFYNEFIKLGYEFHVLACDAQKVDFKIEFPLTIKKFKALQYINFIRNLNPDVVINFLHLKDKIIFPVIYYCKLSRTPIIYWNFGINTATPDAKLKNQLYYHIHNCSDAIILYSPTEKKFIKTKNHHKIFIGYNTLNFTGIDRAKFTDREYLRTRYNIKEKHIILFVGRITPVKRLGILLECLRNKDIAIVIVGSGINHEQTEIIKNTSNYYYLGEISYDNDEISRIFYSSDILCIPGNFGLSLIEALFWGIPAVTFSKRGSPEIYYFKDGYNGYRVKSVKEFEDKISGLLSNPAEYSKMADNARRTYEEKAHIINMFNGFRKAIEYVEKNK